MFLALLFSARLSACLSPAGSVHSGQRGEHRAHSVCRQHPCCPPTRSQRGGMTTQELWFIVIHRTHNAKNREAVKCQLWCIMCFRGCIWWEWPTQCLKICPWPCSRFEDACLRTDLSSPCCLSCPSAATTRWRRGHVTFINFKLM